jgi:hypothetical protein
MPVTRLVYISDYCIDLQSGSVTHQLNEILRTANRKNEANDITGALIFDSVWFVQALEGERSRVWDTFCRIEQDQRHANVTIVEMLKASERLFGSWWMGCSERTAKNAAIFQPFLRGGHFKPDEMSRYEILSLMTNLASVGYKQQF